MSHFTDSNNLPSAGGNRPEHHIHGSSDPIPGTRGVNPVDYSTGAINDNAPSQTWGDSPAGGRGPGGDFPSGTQTNTDFGSHGQTGAAGHTGLGSSGLAGVGSGGVSHTGLGHSGEHGGRTGDVTGLGDVNARGGPNDHFGSSTTGAHNPGHVAPGVSSTRGISGLGDSGTGPTGGHSSIGEHGNHSTGQHGSTGDHNSSHGRNDHNEHNNVPGGKNAFHEERPLDVKPTHAGGVAVGGRSDVPEGKATALDKIAGKTDKVIGKLTGNAEKHERGELREAGGKAAVTGEARVPHD